MTLDELLAQYQPNPDEIKRQRQSALMLNIAGGLLGSRRGQELQGLGRGLLGGGIAAHQVEQDAQHQALQKLQTRSAGMNYLNQEQGYNDQQLLRQQEAEWERRRMGGMLPQMPDAAAPPAQAYGMNDRSMGQAPSNFGMADRSMGMPPPTPPTQQPMSPMMGQAPQAMPPAQGQQPDRRARAQQLQQMAAYWEGQSGPGAAQKAQLYADAAQKAMPQLKEQKTLTQNGKRVTVNFYNDGTHEVLPDLAPDLEKAHVMNTGKYQLGVDPISGEQRFVVENTQSPDSAASNQVTMRGQNMTDARSRDQIAQSDRHFNATQDKPQIISGPNGEVFSVSPRGGTGDYVRGPDGQPLNKGDKPLTESQAKATAYANQMADASAQIGKLNTEGFRGIGAKDQMQIAQAGAQGIPYVPGSAAIPRAMAGEKAQRFQQAELQWTEAALRFMTGASAPKEEVIRNADTYFPRPGDLPARVKQKEESRRAMEQSLRMAAGAAGNKQLPPMSQASGGLTPAEQREYEALKQRFGR